MARRGQRGKGSVFWAAADRRWVAKFPLGGGVFKRAKRKSKPDAQRALDRFERIYGRGGGRSGTLDEWLTKWLDAHGDSVRGSTRTSYAGHVDHHISPLLGGIPLADLQPADVRRLVAELRRKPNGRGGTLSAATIHRIVTTLHVALQAAVDERTIPDNPADGVRLPKVEREPVRALTVDEADAILDAVAGTWIERPVRVWLGSGLRRGEVLGLDQRDIGEGFVRVRVSKTVIRAVPVSDDALSALNEAVAAAPRRGPKEPVFFSPRPNRKGHRDRMRGDSITHALPRILEAAGLDHLTPHALRHGAASIMLADGAPMRVIAEQLGHSNPALTARVYAHVIPEAQRAAIRSLERRRAR